MNRSAAQKIRLIYVIYNENILTSGILHTQVRQMLRYMKGETGIERVRLLSFVSPRLWLRNINNFRRLKSELKHEGIDFKYRLMPAAQTWSWISIPLMVVFCLPIVLTNLIAGRFNVVHTRSYGAGLLGIMGARILGLKCVFDPRGLFPDEMAGNEIWARTGFTFGLWKKIESSIVRAAHATVAVTPQQRRIFQQMGAIRSLYVPSRAGDHFFKVRSERPTPDDSPTLIFTGDMHARWYHPRKVARHFIWLKENIPPLKLRILTPRDAEFVSKELLDSGLSKDDFAVKVVSPQAVPTEIANSRLALLLGVDEEDGWEVWPVKLPEYLAMGIPIVAEKCIGPTIIEIIERWELGAIIDLDDEQSYRQVIQINIEHERYSANCRNYAQKKLHISHSSRQYMRLYRSLLKV